MRLLVILLCLSTQVSAQPFTSARLAEEVLHYEPARHPGVSEANYREGIFILGEVRSATANNAANFNKADYLNLLFAFAKLGEPGVHLELAAQAVIARDTDCEYLSQFHRSISKLTAYPAVVAAWNEARAKCNPVGIEPAFDWMAYAKQYDLDPQLIAVVRQIRQRDQQYRGQDIRNWEARQEPLDRQNQRLIDSLVTAHGGYIGRTLVGEQLETVMWSVVQHAPLPCMEHYLTVMQDAVAAGELPLVPLRMLVDRILWLRHGYQLFGSQSGVPVVAEPTRSRLITEYGLK